MNELMSSILKIGFFINPIAGMGGKVALKGTDGLIDEALRLGADPVSPVRAQRFLESLLKQKNDFLKFLVAPNPMGAQIFRQLQYPDYNILDIHLNNPTTAADTFNVVKKFCQLKVDLILFVGGDGTSVDVFNSVFNNIPILGLPSGVKTYGEVFAHNPDEVIEILSHFVYDKTTHEADILDLDEDAYRDGKLAVKLKGRLLVPNQPQYFQSGKVATSHTVDEEETQSRIAEFIKILIEEQPSNTPFILCPGSVIDKISHLLNIQRSILGVDIYFQNKVQIIDAREDQIYNFCFNQDNISPPIIILTPIFVFFYLFFRGNHLLITRILKYIKKQNIWVIATRNKIKSIQDGVLRCDTADESINNSLKGYLRVIVEKNEYIMMKVV